MAEDADTSEEAERLRKEILAEFEGRVFRDRVWPNPPARGRHGMAKLHLKPGAVPVVGRVIHPKGCRLKAMRELKKDFVKDKKVELGQGPWRCVAFPIKKKNGKGRCACDYALTNKQIQPDSYPYR